MRALYSRSEAAEFSRTSSQSSVTAAERLTPPSAWVHREPAGSAGHQGLCDCVFILP